MGVTRNAHYILTFVSSSSSLQYTKPRGRGQKVKEKGY